MNDTNITTPVVQKRKLFRFRSSATTIPIFSILLVVYYFSPLSLYIYWNWFLTYLVRIFYFPFYILPVDFFVLDGGFIGIPNPLTIGLAAFVSVAIFYFISLIAISYAEKIYPRNGSKIGVIAVLVLISTISIFMSNNTQSKCRIEKEKSYLESQYYDGPTGKIELTFNFMSINEFEAVKENLSLFYTLNSITYIEDGIGSHELVVATQEGNEVNKACSLEAYQQFLGAYPI